MLKMPSDDISSAFVFTDFLSQDISCSGQGFAGILHLFVHIVGCHVLYVGLLLPGNDACKRFQSFLSRHFRAGSSFGFKWEVDVFHFRRIPTEVDALFQFLRQLSLRFDG